MARNEDQTRRDLIDPALAARGWGSDLIRVETTVGGSDIIGGRPRRRKGRTDYLLCLPAPDGGSPLPIAIIEAKKEEEGDALGLQQAQDYRRRFHVPFVFASNGHLYTEWGEDTRHIASHLPLAQFPTPDELRQRYEALRGISLSSPAAAPLLKTYKGGESSRWYFQDAAVRAALEAMATGQDRVLLTLPTGAGKTNIASQLLWKLATGGQLRRALFVCDRDELRTQAWSRLHGFFGDGAQIVTSSNPQANARVLVASYQTLNVDSDGEPQFWRENYPPDYFSHIIIDECHRSAWGKWSVVLRDNPNAVHIGLTATPRTIVGGHAGEPGRERDEQITAHNLRYFGEPVYEYSLVQGQEDGYLAASEVIRRTVDLDATAITRDDIVERSAKDYYTGRTIQPGDIDDQYDARRYEQALQLPDRVDAMCEDLFAMLLETGGPHQKAAIFCVRDTHATEVTLALNNIYEEWCKSTGQKPAEPYAFQCTGNPNLRPSAAELIPDFRGSKASHFVAVTVDLLSTGVDVPDLGNVVFFQYLNSPIEFYQRVGRGTRTGTPQGSKLLFRVYDYTNVTRLFGQPFEAREKPEDAGQPPAPDHDDPGTPGAGPTMIRVEGFDVEVQGAGRSIVVQRGGREALIPLEDYEAEIAAAVQDVVGDLDGLREVWADPQRRGDLFGAMEGGGASLRMLRQMRDQDDCDLYDVVAELTFKAPAKTRALRVAAFEAQEKPWLTSLAPDIKNTVLAMALEFGRGGIDELETATLFDTPAVRNAGGFRALNRHPEGAEAVLTGLKKRLLR
ncbi:DEAD/DEAH box helicase family protein [Blastococcus sp. BMG 814]|uniref:DEAD/DEAH box helicase family protein n=1 Tax=Blastococcus carthaginiensis TaxID=3050034 RepID=A0ABT9IHK5_9ACTN|nr:DEAD/DEAH box helicase family protein [Blastococcus carthaginiensis]MDP5185055.1 DEAD/DEAH box helicase family protein [Blastococcus carthaginiensis]